MGNTHATVLILLATMCTLLSGCTKDNDYTVTTGKGRLNIRLIADGSTQDVATRVEETLPDINDFAISVLKGDEVKYSCDKFSQYSDEVLFPIGQYTLKASYGQLHNEGFNKPCFTGLQEFSIEDQKETNVEVTCYLANVKVSATYTESFKKYFSDYSLKVNSEGNSPIQFAKEETRSCYFKPGKLTLTLNLTKRDGGVQSSYQPIIIDNALAQHHYKFNFDVNAGSSTVNITFTDRTETVTHTIDVSDGTMRIDPPFFILNGFTSNTALDIKEGKEADHPLSLYLNARSGIEECILTTSSSPLISQGWPAYIDLADLSTDKLQLLQSFGLQLKGLGANKDKIATIDFTNVIPHIEYDNGALSTFKLVAKDKLKKVNKEEVILAINSLSNQFAVASPEALPSGSTYIDLVVTLDGKPETIKASCILYGASQDLKCGLLSTEGDGITHHIRVTFPVKITSSTQMTVTCGRKKTTFTLSVN